MHTINVDDVIAPVTSFDRVIVALTSKAHPSIESFTRRIVTLPHMPLTEKACLVTRLLQVAWKKHKTFFGRIVVIDNLMILRCESS